MTTAIEDKTLECQECHKPFAFTADEQAFFHSMKFQHEPKRCKNCRARKAGKRTPKPENRVVCAQCGTPCTVPFKPTQGRPVLCRACFKGVSPVEGRGAKDA